VTEDSVQPPILEARGLMKRYGKIQALAGLDLVVSQGRVVALLGPNGAGKTTFVRAVATLLRPDAGTLHVDGIDALRQPAKVRQVVGLAGQFAAVEEAMTGRENLRMVGRLFGLNRKEAKAAAARVLDQMQLTADADRLVRGYSGGMRRRIDLGISLVGTPRLLLLDEPSAGLAPLFVDAMFEQVQAINRAGVTILMVEQNARRALALSHRGYVLDLGQNRFTGTGQALLDDPRLAELYLG
jgi:ABC-2 type transport system ATP-binding protein